MDSEKRLLVLWTLSALAWVLGSTAPLLAAQATLTWQDPNNSAAQVGGYNLYYWQAGATTRSKVSVGKQTSHTLQGLQDGITYNFAVTAYAPGGSRESTFSNQVSKTFPPQPSDPTPVPAPVANFSATPLTGTAPSNVLFTDTSTGNITARSWTFGDGGTSTALQPGHTYTTAGTYTVSLTVTGPGGSHTKTRTGYITVSAGGGGGGGGTGGGGGSGGGGTARLITIEAELMTLSGYKVENNPNASGGKLISRAGATGTSPGTAKTTFAGTAGTYDVTVTYFDERDGQSTFKFFVNGTRKDTWIANADLPSGDANLTTLTHRVVARGLALAPGHVIQLQGSEQQNEPARLDKIDFAPVVSGTQVIVDNQDDETASTGTWKVSSGANPWEGQSLYNTTTPATFRWTPRVPTAGSYKVYSWWTYKAGRATKVPYRIRHASGTATVTVNQRDQALSGKWHLLGTFRFDTSGNGYIEVSGENGQACADAVRLVKQ